LWLFFSRNVIFQNNKLAVASSWAAGDINFDTCSFIDNIGDLGAAIVSNDAARVIVTNSTFTGNNATVSGAAILANVSPSGSAVLVTDSTFTNNRALDGGAIFAFSENTYAPLGDIRFTRSRFTRNVATQSGGAASIATTARTAFTDCIFEQNQAASGGALYLPLASNLENALFQRCEFNMNMATGTGNRASGGALFSANPVDIRNSKFNANTAALSGGAVFSQAEIFLSDSSLSSNVAAQSGGALYFDSASVPAVERNVFDRNNATAGHGGAIYSASVRLTSVNNDFDTNRALAGSGAAIYNEVGTLGVSAGDFTHNEAMNGAAAVYSAGVTTITGDASFVGNKAASAGALACVSATSGSAAFALTLTDVTFDGNVALTGNAGAVDAGLCTTTVSNAKFMNNDAAGHGGSIVVSDAASLRVTGSQFTNNVADGAGAGIYADSVQSIFLNTISSSGNVAARGGGLLTVNESTSVLELRGLTGSGNVPSDVFVDPSAGSTLAVTVVDSSAPGAIEVSTGTLTVTAAAPVSFAGLHLFGQASLVTNVDLNVTASFKWGHGSISGTRTGLTLTIGASASGSLLRDSLSANSSRSLVGFNLLNYGNLTVGYVADSNGSYPLTAPKEVPCLSLLGASNFTTFNSSRTTLGFNCLVSAPAGSVSRLNVSGLFDLDGSVVLDNVALTIFNKSLALTTFHLRNLKAAAEDDFDNLVIRGRNDSYLGGQLAILNQGSQFRPDATFTYTAILIKAPLIYGNFSKLNVNVTVNTTADGTTVPSDKPYGVIRHTLVETTLVIDEKNRPDPNSGQVAVIVVSIILALIGAGVLALYIRSIVKCFIKKPKEDEEDDDGSDSSDEEKPLTKSNNDAQAREQAEMDRVDADAGKKKKGKKSTNEVELVEVADEAPARKKKSDKKKEKEPEPELQSESAPSEEVKPVKSEKKSSKKAVTEEKPAEAEKPEKKAEKKPEKKSAKKAESSEDVSSSDDESESESEGKPIAKAKSAAKEKASKKKAESSDSSSESS
jgi:predicted outer membrane repeat protein